MAHPSSVLFLYGSQTGNAESICRDLHFSALGKGFPAGVSTLNDCSPARLAAAVVAVIVCSTTGDGDAPDNAVGFLRWLRRQSAANAALLGNLHYTILALGDQNYSRFCEAGRKINGFLSGLGARLFYRRGEADDGVGLEAVVEPWKQDLWGSLSQAMFFGSTVPPPTPCKDAGDDEMQVDTQSKSKTSTEGLITPASPNGSPSRAAQGATTSPTSMTPAAPAPSGAAAAEAPPLLLLYGSQTGNAESICTDLYRMVLSMGFTARLAPLNRHAELSFPTAPVAIIVCSSSGNGDAPDNAAKFVRWLKKAGAGGAAPLLQGMRYTVL
eukprot:RCo014858